MQRRIADAGLLLERHGCGWRVHGYGVDVLAADLANLSPADPVPIEWTNSGGWHR